MFRHLRHLGFIVLVISFAADGELRADTPERAAYNVLLISLDTLRADHCGCYGYGRNTTPNLDKLASEGILFENAVAASSWTVPSHMSVFTSLYPSVHGVGSFNVRLGDGVPTMAELLRENGYTTAGFVTGPTLSHKMGIGRGFEFYDDFTVRMMCDTNLFEDIPGDAVDVNQVPTNHVITKLAVNWLRNNAEKRFFLFVHYWDCHFDYIPPPPYDKRFGPEYKGQENGRDIVRRQGQLEKSAGPVEKQRIVALFDGEVAYTDANLGNLLQVLDDLRLSANTIVIVFSDHGEGFWEHGKLCHGYGLQEELLHVPLVMKLPGILPSGFRVKENVSHMDVLPTLLGLLKLPKPPFIHGLDLSDACRNREELPNRPIFSEINKEGHEMRAIRWGPYKMIQEKGDQRYPLLVVRNGEEFVWNEADETAARELQDEMASILNAGPPSLASPDRMPRPVDSDEDTLRLLRSLGYVP